MRIFLVDDDAVQRMIMADFLASPVNELFEFEDGEAMLANLDKAPELILLDVEMPRLDGIASCRRLREAGHDLPQVIFISSHDDMETRLAAYAAGGSDFVVKPFMPVDLLGKVDVARTLLSRHATYVSDIQLAQRTAFTAMSSMGELGAVLQFLRKTLASTSLDEIAGLLLDAFREYGLSGTLELRSGDCRETRSTHGACSPLEISILHHARSMGRLFQFRSQLAVNYPHVTFVVRNLPDDEENVGRLRDHLATLAEGVDARVMSLAMESERARQSKAIAEHAAALARAIEDIERQHAAHRVELLNLAQTYLDDLTRMFTSLALTESQEFALFELARQANDRATRILDGGKETAEQLRRLAARLQETG